MKVRQIVLTSSLLFGVTLQAQQPDQDCVDWFKSSKVMAGSKSCEIECAALMTDMGTFMCPDQCDILCKSVGNSTVAGKLIFYPGLTPAEKRLVEQYPKDALTVFVQKTRAEWSSSRNFPDQNLNDESDAFRHFVWAGLLTKELGAKRAEEFLDAHEANPLQSTTEKDMDTFNNEKGLRASQQFISEKKWSQQRLEAAGLEKLRSKELRVMKPGLKIPEKPR